MRQIEPALQGTFHGGFFTDSDSTGDIHKFTFGLSQALERMGVQTIYDCDVTSVNTTGERVQLVYAKESEFQSQTADVVVVCCGTNSRELAAQLGDRVNIYPVKGYSITVNLDDAQSQASAPHVSLLDDATKLVSSRLGVNRFRVAGTAEFNGFNKDIRADRIQPLVDWVAQCFPGVSTRQFTPWAGLRPMMPNMLPKVGPGKAPNVFYNTGHGHLGWTLSGLPRRCRWPKLWWLPERRLLKNRHPKQRRKQLELFRLGQRCNARPAQTHAQADHPKSGGGH